jgi:hypothetical protein
MLQHTHDGANLGDPAVVFSLTIHFSRFGET